MLTQAGTEKLPQRALRIEYEPEVDILTIYLQDRETALINGDELEPGIILNYAENGGLASIEIMDAGKRYPPGELAAASVDELIDLKTASKLASIAPVTLRTQAGKGKLWALRLGGRWLTTRERLQQYVDNRSRKTAA